MEVEQVLVLVPEVLEVQAVDRITLQAEELVIRQAHPRVKVAMAAQVLVTAMVVEEAAVLLEQEVTGIHQQVGREVLELPQA
jgi:hypothetical protein